MRIIICDRCGKKTNEDKIRRSMTISRQKDDCGGIIVTRCDKLKLVSRGELKMEEEIDLCDACKESFVKWFGNIGIYEEG